MPDITMCKGEECPLKWNCYRHNAKHSPLYQSFFIGTPYDKEKQNCKYFWQDERTEKIQRTNP